MAELMLMILHKPVKVWIRWAEGVQREAQPVCWARVIRFGDVCLVSTRELK